MKFSLYSLGLFFITSALLSFSLPTHAAIKIALNWKAEPEFGGFYEADLNGFFKSAGLDVQISEGGSGTPTVQMLASGTTDYAIVAGDEIVVSHDRGAKNIVAIFATYQTNPAGIMVHSERNFQGLKDVFQNEGTLLWQNGLPFTQYMNKKYGPFKVKTAPYQGGIANFASDKKLSQQCFVTSEPILAKAAKLNVKSFLISESGFNPYTAVLATTWDRVKKNPKEVQAVVEAVRKGWENYLKNPKKTNEFMHSLNKSMSLEVFKESAFIQEPLILTKKQQDLGKMSDKRWKELISQLHEIGTIKTKPEVKEIFTDL